MQFKQVAAILASYIALSNAIALPEAAADQGLALDIAAPESLKARSLDSHMKEVRKLAARADQAEELADQLQTRDAEDAAIEAREAHEDKVKMVRRAIYYSNDDAYRRRSGLGLSLLGGDLLDLNLGTDEYGYDRTRYYNNNGGRRRRNYCDYNPCW